MANEGVKLVVRGKLTSGYEWRNIFYYQGTGDWNDTTIQNWVADIYAPIALMMHTDWQVYGVDVASRINLSDPLDPKGWSASDYVAKQILGVSTGDPLPPADAAVVILRTGVKHVMGRKFMSGLTEGQQANGVLIPAALTNLQSFANKILGMAVDPLGSGSSPSVWGPTRGWHTIIGVKADSELYHLDRRQRGRGI